MDTIFRVAICVIIFGFSSIMSSASALEDSQKLQVEHRGGPLPPPHTGFGGPGPGGGGPFPPPPPQQSMAPPQNNELWATTRSDMPQIKNLNVLCEKNHMKVAIEFDRPFHGMIFSKGHFGDHSCVYLKPGSGFVTANFEVFMNNCGTGSSAGNLAANFAPNPGNTFIENTIIIQYDPAVQEVWDQARKLRCTWYDFYEKSVTFKPYNVDTLQAVQANFLGDNVQCWMQIQAGKGPWANEVDGIVKIGQTMTMVLAIKDDENKFDMLVRNCVAHDGNRPPIQLVDDFGCVIRPKVMSPFQKIKNFGASASVISYSYFQAFKFPDSMNVFFQCVIQVCRHQCPEPACGGGGGGGIGMLRGEMNTVDPRVVASESNIRPQIDGSHLIKVNPQQPQQVALPLTLGRPVKTGQPQPQPQSGYPSVGREGNSANITKSTQNGMMNGRPRAANLNKQENVKRQRRAADKSEEELTVPTTARMIQVVAPGDVAFNLGGGGANENVIIANSTYSRKLHSSVCLTVSSFVAGLVILLLIVAVACLVASFLFVKMRSDVKKSTHAESTFSNPEMVNDGSRKA